MRGKETTEAASGRIPSLDGLRAIAVLMVIVRHTGYGLEGMASFGVQIFFVLSGYLITKLLLTEQRETGVVDLKAFYLRRCFRILPAAFVYMLVVAALVPDARPDLQYALTYTSCYHLDWHSRLLQHLWSLSVEEQFYLLWPLVLAFAFRKRIAVAIAAMAIAAGFRVAITVSMPGQFSQLVHCAFPAVMDSIAAGCLLAIFEPKLVAVYRRAEKASLPLMLGLPLAAFALATAHGQGGAAEYAAMRPVPVALWGAVPLLIAMWIFVAVQRRDWILNNRVAIAIGALSYSLYLWQQPFAYVGAGFVNGVLLLLFATLSYVLVETPMIKLGRSFARRGRKEPKTSVPQMLPSATP